VINLEIWRPADPSGDLQIRLEIFGSPRGYQTGHQLKLKL
jgi:hypothetical protein